MEERRGLETGAATESWRVELGADRLGPTLGRTESTMSPRNAGLLAARVHQCRALLCLLRRRRRLSSLPATALNLKSCCYARLLLSNVYAQSKPVIRLVQCAVRTV